METKLEALVETEVKTEVKTLEDKERQTIVHCSYNPLAAVRVWPSTFLVEKESGRRAKLITAYNISFAPEWTFGAEQNCFTLVFEGLSKECKVFDLVEIIPLPDPFVIRNIHRTESDVYNLTIS